MAAAEVCPRRPICATARAPGPSLTLMIAVSEGRRSEGKGPTDRQTDRHVLKRLCSLLLSKAKKSFLSFSSQVLLLHRVRRQLAGGHQFLRGRPRLQSGDCGLRLALQRRRFLVQRRRRRRRHRCPSAAPNDDGSARTDNHDGSTRADNHDDRGRRRRREASILT